MEEVGKSKYCSRDRTDRRDGEEGNEEQERYEEKDRTRIDRRVEQG